MRNLVDVADTYDENAEKLKPFYCGCSFVKQITTLVLMSGKVVTAIVGFVTIADGRPLLAVGALTPAHALSLA